MQISPVSHSAAVYGSSAAQAPTPKSTAAPADSVHLSSAAQAKVSGGDVDHDGDSH